MNNARDPLDNHRTHFSTHTHIHKKKKKKKKKKGQTHDTGVISCIQTLLKSIFHQWKNSSHART